MIATWTGRERRGFIFSIIGDLVNLFGRQSDHSGIAASNFSLPPALS
jgi:hypothetical protein